MDQVDVVFGELDLEYGRIAGAPPPVSIPDLPEAFSNEHLQLGAYDDYLIDTEYETDTGLRVIPKASSGEYAEIANSAVRIHRGTTDKIVTWTCQRENKKPKIPTLTTKDPNEIPIRQTILFANKYQGINNVTVYRVSGINYYSLLKPKNAQSNYPIGTTPAEIAPSSTNFFSPGDFDDGIIDSAFATPGGANLEIPIRVGT